MLDLLSCVFSCSFCLISTNTSLSFISTVLLPLLVYNQAKKGGGKKKPLTGFMLFAKEHRPKVKEDNPDLTFGQLGKKLGEMWRALSDSEKEAYKKGKK